MAIIAKTDSDESCGMGLLTFNQDLKKTDWLLFI